MFGRLGRRAATATAMIASVTLFHAVDAHGYVLKQTKEGARVRWAETRVTMAIDPGVERALPGASEAIREAAKGWGTTSKDVPELSIINGNEGGTAGQDGLNGVFYAKGEFGPGGRALAVTVLTYEEQSGRIVDADVIINGKYDFSMLTSSAARTDTTMSMEHGDDDEEPPAVDGKLFDLVHVSAHELGHALGLGDERENANALMYAYTSAGDSSRREPQADDREGIAIIYNGPVPTEEAGCAASVSPEKPDFSARIVLTLALGFALFLGLRGRARSLSPIAAACAWLIAAPPSVRADQATLVAKPMVALTNARVVSVDTADLHGLYRTQVTVETNQCDDGSTGCVRQSQTSVWGGSRNGFTQVIGEQAVPKVGARVAVRFDKTRAITALRLAP